MNLSSTGLTRARLGSCLSIAMLRIAMEVNTQYGICDDDSDDDDDDDDGDQVDTNITNLSDGSGEDLGDLSSQDFNAIDLSLDQEGSSEGGEASEGEGEAGSLHPSVLETEWYRQYAEYQASTGQGER